MPAKADTDKDSNCNAHFSPARQRRGGRVLSVETPRMFT